jgi:hypothetical protein
MTPPNIVTESKPSNPMVFNLQDEKERTCKSNEIRLDSSQGINEVMLAHASSQHPNEEPVKSK